jgi:hypothetical protein
MIRSEWSKPWEEGGQISYFSSISAIDSSPPSVLEPTVDLLEGLVAGAGFEPATFGL